MAGKKQFYLKFNIKDFKTDQKVCNCSANANGVYIHLLCVLFDSEERGKYLMRSDCLKNFAEILPQQNVQQNNRQIVRQIESICRCVAEHLAKHLPFTVREIETGLAELLENDVIYIEGHYLCQKRMIHDSKVSASRSKSGKKGAEKTNRRGKKNDDLAEILPQQNDRQKEQQKSNYNYNYNYKEEDSNRGIGNTEGVQGAESLGEEKGEGLAFVNFEGNWGLAAPVEMCAHFFFSHEDFKNDRDKLFERIKYQLIDLPDDEVWERLKRWARVFNDGIESQTPTRPMRGKECWPQHFVNWFKKRESITVDPAKLSAKKQTAGQNGVAEKKRGREPGPEEGPDAWEKWYYGK